MFAASESSVAVASFSSYFVLSPTPLKTLTREAISLQYICEEQFKRGTWEELKLCRNYVMNSTSLSQPGEGGFPSAHIRSEQILTTLQLHRSQVLQFRGRQFFGLYYRWQLVQ
jgi:hypothetical protein